LVSLTLGLAIYLFAKGILEFLLALRLRPLAGSGWLFIDGIITIILGVMIWQAWPSSTAWAVGILVGVSMLFSGVARLMISLAARRLVSALALIATTHFRSLFRCSEWLPEFGERLPPMARLALLTDVLALAGLHSLSVCPAARASRDSIPRGFSGQSLGHSSRRRSRAEF